MSAPTPANIPVPEPKPVTPAEAIPVVPAKALDPLVGEPTFVDKALAQAKPYLDKVNETTRPYVDAAAAKAKEVIDKIEGQPAGAAGTTSATGERVIPVAPSTETASTSSGKGFLDQVQSTFTNLTNTIDQKTTTANHPGVITQLTNVVNKGISKVDEFVNADSTPGGVSGTGAVPGSHPIATTTNTVPHPASTTVAVPNAPGA